jgi:MHS family shikimate/dehydroshikimate transporter-like MFS transporter
MSTRTDAAGNSVKKIAIASLIGTTMEFYDFLIYGTIAALAFGPVFFPGGDPLIGLLSSYATFAVGFFARPVGGLIFGHFGDKIGRKTMLVITMMIMGIATLLIGFLPTYASVGIWAPVLLICCRIGQGLALGGEWGGAALMILESAPEGKRGVWSSVTQMGASIGMIIGTGIVAAVTQLPGDAFLVWGWRVPFWFSAILVIVGLIVRLSVKESKVYEKVKEAGHTAKVPLLELLRNQPKNIVLAAGIGATNNTTYYFVSTIAISYGVTTLGVARSVMVNALLVVSVVYLFTLPFFASLSDKYGRKTLVKWSLILSVLFAFPYFAMLQSGNFFIIALAMTLLLGVIQSMSYSTQAAFFPELFDPRYRYTGSSLAINLATSIFGGTCPFIATAMLKWSGGATWPLSVYLIMIACMSLVCVSFINETYQSNVGEYQARNFKTT